MKKHHQCLRKTRFQQFVTFQPNLVEVFGSLVGCQQHDRILRGSRIHYEFQCKKVVSLVVSVAPSKSDFETITAAAGTKSSKIDEEFVGNNPAYELNLS